MSGQFFDYQEGRVDVRFRHEKHDWLRMLVRGYGESTTVTDVDDDFEPTSSRVLEMTRRQLSCRISSVFCPFRSLLAWLEAVATGVQECAFEWEAEGPFGRLAWNHLHLVLEWHEDDRKDGMRIRAGRKQVVRAFYSAFRRFVESTEYDPLRYERLRNGEAMVLKIEGRLTEDEFIGQLLILGGTEAEARLQEIWPLGELRDGGVVTRPWLEPKWDRWAIPARRDYLRKIFAMQGLGHWGAPLRSLRSEIVEQWIRA